SGDWQASPRPPRSRRAAAEEHDEAGARLLPGRRQPAARNFRAACATASQAVDRRAAFRQSHRRCRRRISRRWYHGRDHAGAGTLPLFVGQGSTSPYKGRNTDIRQIGQDLGIRYVVKGSLRKQGGNLRITAELADTSSGNQVWAHHYDLEQQDAFTVQD